LGRCEVSICRKEERKAPDDTEKPQIMGFFWQRITEGGPTVIVIDSA
jgi:hypothetical protein